MKLVSPLLLSAEDREVGAPPARESLKMELEMLGLISGRNFHGELNGPPGFLSEANDITSG